ncbi:MULTISPECIES: NAD-dependent epimerase/dehydratase family protein [Chloracidobacterium]|jgi:UDP-glucose 4-epimerase|uniref:Nucleoside-diphosphate-sugar epimerase n=1 Tax=Chloracidobacterium thermophilum (strain B) TaxID=981222 RepID=G2LKE0_CHLTF|nr:MULTISPECIES: NAD-dependent epimerase/dehydratase family protein [Chloracidobacterium]AEP13226.1 Nucleoside-diphosphate-sugar epimerase [Chloracidobacterium thermophilum B]QUV80512.1 NAD-dependent epimerase/dehydratase family protein [Chloracidobacterium thermophilum]QUV82987.1 NAD-dependent epimerase/dehydratase family protein [Chloracidobacterium sp. D]
MATILVTGGNGFIGSHLVDRLAGQASVIVFDRRERRYDPPPPGVRVVTGSLSDRDLVRNVLTEFGVETVYHLAWSSIHETATRHPVADIEANLLPTVQLLDACREAGVRRVVYVSSGGTVYGTPCAGTIAEDHPTQPINAYGVTKLTVEKYLGAYHHLYGLEYVIFRPSVPYGPRQNPLGRQGAVTVFLYRALRGEPVVIFGDGQTSRDFFFVTDMLEPLVQAGSGTAGVNRVFNLGGGHAYSLNELVATIESVIGRSVTVRYEPARRIDAPFVCLDCKAARRTFGWHPVTSLEAGIARTAAWMQAAKLLS